MRRRNVVAGSSEGQGSRSWRPSGRPEVQLGRAGIWQQLMLKLRHRLGTPARQPLLHPLPHIAAGADTGHGSLQHRPESQSRHQTRRLSDTAATCRPLHATGRQCICMFSPVVQASTGEECGPT